MSERAPPTAMAMLIGTAIIAGVSGYMIGIASSLGVLPIPFAPKRPVARGVSNYDDEEESEEEDIDESILDHAPNWANGIEADKRDGLRAPKPTVAKKEEKDAGESILDKIPTFTKDDKLAGEDGTEDCKMVLVVRTDLKMTKGKIAAQCAHAALACYKHFLRRYPRSSILRRWERSGQTKVAVQVQTKDDLDTLQAVAMSMKVVAEVIADAGRTQIEPGSHTVLAVGPAPLSVINEITGHLKLL